METAIDCAPSKNTKMFCEKTFTEAYLKPCQASKIECFVKIVYGF